MMRPVDETDDDVRLRGAPHGITLFDHATIAAELAEGSRPYAEVLSARGLNDAQWNESTSYWMTRMGDEVRERGKDAMIPQVYSDAFGKAQSALAEPPSMDAASYAKLVVEIQSAGGPARPLAARGLSTADYLRLSRHYARVLSSDPEQARLYFEAYQAAQPKGEEG
jgi:hypothetical protein